MFESAEIDHHIDRKAYEKAEVRLREGLLDAQYQLRDRADFAVLLVVSGLEGAGSSEVINVLKEWLDPRYLIVRAYRSRTDEERERPEAWRYWRGLPPKGRIGVMFSAWYAEVLAGRVLRGTPKARFLGHLSAIKHDETMLSNEDVLVLKFWIHIPRQVFKERTRKRAKRASEKWRVTDEQLEAFKRYDELKRAAAITLQHTNTANAPWAIVDGVDERYRNIAVGTALLEAMQQRLAGKPRPPAAGKPVKVSLPADNLIDQLDLSRKLGRGKYKSQLAKWQRKLGELTRDRHFARTSLVVAFEGQDAAGKGSAIRRVTAALDARDYEVHPIAAPSDEERMQPYLWRFWRHVPARGRVAIFDRSWYGRVLVERVAGFAGTADWSRAYEEIVDFETRLTEYGVVVVKFWLAISKEEQLRRFREREKISFKRFKITREDWRNRKAWNQYTAAVCEMVDRTSTVAAPWTLVEANDKPYARVKVLKTICQRLESVL